MGWVARGVCARPLLVIVVGIVCAIASIFVVAFRFNVVNNTSDLLSDKYESKRTYDELVKDFGSDSRFIVLIRSPDPAKNRQAADEIGPFLETLKPHVATVLYKIDFSRVKPRLLFTRTVPELKKIADQVESQVAAQNQSQQKSEQIALDLNSILDQANQKFNDKYLRQSSNWKEFMPFVTQFISILNKVSTQAEGKTDAPAASDYSPDSSAEDYDSDEMLAQHEYFSLQNGKALLVFGYPGTPDPDGAAPYSTTVATIRQHLADLQSKYPGVEMKLTGEPALDADEIITSTDDTIKAMGITVTLIVLLFGFSYRTVVRPTLIFLVLIMGVLWSLGFALLTVGHFNEISMAVIPMVLGIGIDFGIQILGRYEEELGRNRTVTQAIAASLQHTGVAIITGASTTAAAFFTLCFNDFVGLAELGEIAGASMILLLAANLVLLPATFYIRDRNRTPEQLRAQSSNSAWHFIHNWDHGPHPLDLGHPRRHHLDRLHRQPPAAPFRLQPAPSPKPLRRFGEHPLRGDGRLQEHRGQRGFDHLRLGRRRQSRPGARPPEKAGRAPPRRAGRFAAGASPRGPGPETADHPPHRRCRRPAQRQAAHPPRRRYPPRPRGREKPPRPSPGRPQAGQGLQRDIEDRPRSSPGLQHHDSRT
jgi:hypothetical protein